MAQYRPGGLNITPVVKNLIIINIIVFVAQQFFASTGRQLEEYGALWQTYTGNFKVWQLVTYMFMHADIFHILFNMYGLYIFGTELEGLWGSKRFLEFYMICGIAAGVAQLLIPRGAVAIGASGAVMGVLAGFGYLFPNRPLGLLFIPIPIAAKYLISGLVLMDLFSGVSGSHDGIAHFAHLGGALTGLIIVVIWNRNNRRNFY